MLGSRKFNKNSARSSEVKGVLFRRIAVSLRLKVGGFECTILQDSRVGKTLVTAVKMGLVP